MGMSEVQLATRRNFFRRQVGGLAGAFLTTAGVEFMVPDRLSAQAEMSPQAALEELLAGNKRFTTRRMTADAEDLAILRENTAEKQQPFVAVLSCSDSRVPVEIIFDQSIGHVFVARVAGNIVSPEIIGSLEYGAAVLGTKAILVLGHANCGAVKATIQSTDAPGQISALYSRIHPAVEQAGSKLEPAIKANAKIQSALLRKTSTVISGLVKENKLKVSAAYYDLVTGAVTLLE